MSIVVATSMLPPCVYQAMRQIAEKAPRNSSPGCCRSASLRSISDWSMPTIQLDERHTRSRRATSIRCQKYSLRLVRRQVPEASPRGRCWNHLRVFRPGRNQAELLAAVLGSVDLNGGRDDAELGTA